jgi:hypothetical protein
VGVIAGRVRLLASLPIVLLAGASGPIARAQGVSPSATPPAAAPAQGAAAMKPPETSPAGTPMTATAKGPFDVTLTPQGAGTDPTAVGRMTLDKTFHGDLEATSTGEMLAVRTAVAGSAGYVAIERVSGTLAGRSGTFALQHWGIMDKNTPDLRISVIPDSGTGQLAGLAGTMTIDIQPGGKHFYTFSYTLPPGGR